MVRLPHLTPVFIMMRLKQLATLNVQEAMGMKVDREAVATLVLPQLWTLSMGPSEFLFRRTSQD
jgi:SCY1-like protein 2